MATKEIANKESISAPWLKGMTDDEFNAWWETGPLMQKWFDLNQAQRHEAHHVKMVFKDITTQNEIDAGLVFGLMQLATDLQAKLIERQAYMRGYRSAITETRAALLGATRTIMENPLADTALKSLSMATEMALSNATNTVKRNDAKSRQEAKNTAARCREPRSFLEGLITLDAMPGAKHSRHLRSFFACLFAEHFKPDASRAGLVVKIIKFCFHEKMNSAALKQARAAFKRSFPNWRGVAKQLFKALQPRLKRAKSSLAE
jgi:hypothetical protein